MGLRWTFLREFDCCSDGKNPAVISDHEETQWSSRNGKKLNASKAIIIYSKPPRWIIDNFYITMKSSLPVIK